MPRCPNGSRKNKKTGNCDSITSNSSPVSMKASASPASATKKVMPRCPKGSRKNKKTGNCDSITSTKKVKRVAKAKIYLDEGAIDHIIDANMDTIEYMDVSIPKMKQVLSKVYYKPRFESEFYAGRTMKRKLKKRGTSADDIIDELLYLQVYALIREWGKGYIRLSDFTSSQSFYSHSDE
jgi:hypothetical protein